MTMEEGSPTDAEKRLLVMLASLKEEATPEAAFEERFLYDFHELVARDAVCRPARHRVWEHIQQMFANFGLRRIAYGASTLGIGALAVGYVAMPDGGEPPHAMAVAHEHFERSVSSLAPALSRDADPCTTSSCITVERDAFGMPRPKDIAALEMKPSSYRSELEDYTSAAPVSHDEWSVHPQRAYSGFMMPAF